MSHARASSSTTPLRTTTAPSQLGGALWRTFECRMLEFGKEYFSADSTGESEDPLVDMIARDPEAAMSFMRTVMQTNNAGSIATFLLSFTYLALRWTECGLCERPLRWWLVVHSLLQVSQVPVRVAFLAHVRAVEERQASSGGLIGEELHRRISELTLSPAWRTSKQVALVTYGWFVLGIVWMLNAGSCRGCVGLYWLTLAVILQALARGILALALFRSLFPQLEPQEQEAEPQKVQAATEKIIASIPVVRFRPEDFEPEASCAICLSEYEVGDRLRRFPCGHHFHAKCADRWLRRNKRCPLCMGAVDDAPCSCHPARSNSLGKDQ